MSNGGSDNTDLEGSALVCLNVTAFEDARGLLSLDAKAMPPIFSDPLGYKPWAGRINVMPWPCNSISGKFSIRFRSADQTY